MDTAIGVDGGGSKTELVLVDSDGNVRARHIASGCNPNLCGYAEAGTILEAALEHVAASAGLPASTVKRVLLCMAGSRAHWQETAVRLSARWGMVRATDDSLPVLELATGGGPGLVLHSGTGSFVAARDPAGAAHYAGGLGWRLGDPGSAADIGRRGIAAGLLQLQGWRKRGGLAEALKALGGGAEPGDIVRTLYGDAAATSRIAAFSREVLRLAQSGEDAREVLRASLEDLVALALTVCKRLFPAAEGLPCGLSGPILTSPPAAQMIGELFAAHSVPLACSSVRDAPIEGVRRLLLREGQPLPK